MGSHRVCHESASLTTPLAIQTIECLFAEAGLTVPLIPTDLASQLLEQHHWCFSTKPLARSPYAFEEYVREGTKADVKDYLVLAHAGHGVNSYALSYYLVRKPLRLFLQVAWGGVYMEETEARVDVNRCFDLTHRLTAAVDLARDGGGLRPGDLFVIAASDFYGGYWLKPGETPPSEGSQRSSGRPCEILTEAVTWAERLANG